MKIGTDIGGVCIGGTKENHDTFFGSNFLKTPEIEDAFDSLIILSIDHEVHWVSKCGPKVEEKTVQWLQAHQWLEPDLIKPGRLHFVRRRELKVPMALALQLDVFIDDRIEICTALREAGIPHVIQFESWSQVTSELYEIIKNEKQENG